MNINSFVSSLPPLCLLQMRLGTCHHSNKQTYFTWKAELFALRQLRQFATYSSYAWELNAQWHVYEQECVVSGTDALNSHFDVKRLLRRLFFLVFVAPLGALSGKPTYYAGVNSLWLQHLSCRGPYGGACLMSMCSSAVHRYAPVDLSDPPPRNQNSREHHFDGLLVISPIMRVYPRGLSYVTPSWLGFVYYIFSKTGSSEDGDTPTESH